MKAEQAVVKITQYVMQQLVSGTPHDDIKKTIVDQLKFCDARTLYSIIKAIEFVVSNVHKGVPYQVVRAHLMQRDFSMEWIAALMGEALIYARTPYGACPLCESKDVHYMEKMANPVVPPAMRWMRCSACDHVFTDGYHSPELQDLFFKFDGTSVRYTINQEFIQFMEKVRPMSGRRVERVMQYVDRGTWLDVGFGAGSLLLTAQEYGYTPVGIDLNPNLLRRIQGFDVEAYCTTLEAFDRPAGSFSVISMTDVIEHLPYPQTCLTAVGRLLERGGALFVVTPNRGSAVWRMNEMNGFNAYYGTQDHYHAFSREGLYALLSRHGLKPVSFAVSERFRMGMEVIAIKE
ncbi:MAG: class I SAM-dependent methyltransferase [Magnetococcus sp. DMHC-8]